MEQMLQWFTGAQQPAHAMGHIFESSYTVQMHFLVPIAHNRVMPDAPMIASGSFHE
jgi:hypothetical protein